MFLNGNRRVLFGSDAFWLFQAFLDDTVEKYAQIRQHLNQIDQHIEQNEANRRVADSDRG